MVQVRLGVRGVLIDREGRGVQKVLVRMETGWVQVLARGRPDMRWRGFDPGW